jgi:hypothetical protein
MHMGLVRPLAVVGRPAPVEANARVMPGHFDRTTLKSRRYNGMLSREHRTMVLLPVSHGPGDSCYRYLASGVRTCKVGMMVALPNSRM